MGPLGSACPIDELCFQPFFSFSIGLDQFPTGYSHQRILPRRTQKWDWHPVRNQTEGWSVGRPRLSVVTSQRGRTPLRTIISRRSPHPQGHSKPTLQSSPSSRIRIRFLRGRRAGSVSPCRILSDRHGAKRATSVRHQIGTRFMRQPSGQRAPADRARAPADQCRSVLRRWRQTRPRKHAPPRHPQA